MAVVQANHSVMSQVGTLDGFSDGASVFACAGGDILVLVVMYLYWW